MDREIIEIPVISESIRKIGVPLSPVVRANGFIFVSGMPGIDLSSGALVNGDIESQTTACLDALKFCLESAGSTLDKVVKATVYVSNAAHFARVNKIYAQYFPRDRPARTFVAIGSWPLDFDIEIECIALA